MPDTLLQILGLSQRVLVGGRFAKLATTSDLDGLITELRQRETVLQRAAVTGINVDEAGKPLATLAAKPEAPPKDVDAAAALVPTAVKRFRDLAAEVEILLEAMVHQSIDTARLANPALN